MIQRETRQAIDGAQVSFKRQSPDNSNHATVEIKYPVNNISRGGLKFSATEIFEVDERVELTLYLSNGHVHNLHARICYCQDNGMDAHHDYGVSFLDHYLVFE
ncbi:MAG: PilZ domain-containing protein [Gammaproteobacteria bacterium]|nr:PilZ domain-containing protein [Gammaproteobacteria bacterium]